MTSHRISPFASSSVQRSGSISSMASNFDAGSKASLSRTSTASVFSDAGSQASFDGNDSPLPNAAHGVAHGLASQASLQAVAGVAPAAQLQRTKSLLSATSKALGSPSAEAAKSPSPSPGPSNQGSEHITGLKEKFKLNDINHHKVTSALDSEEQLKMFFKNQTSDTPIHIESIKPELIPKLMELLNKHSLKVVFKQDALTAIIKKADESHGSLPKLTNLKGIAFDGCELKAADIQKIIHTGHIDQIKDVLLSNCTFENEESQKEVLRTIAPQAKKVSFSGTNIPSAVSLLLMYPHGISIGIDNNDSNSIKKWCLELFEDKNKGLLSNLKGLEIPNYIASDAELKRLLDDSNIEHLTLSKVTTEPNTDVKGKVHNILVEKFKQNIKFDIKFTDNTFNGPALIENARTVAVKQQKEAIAKDKAEKAAKAAAAAAGTQQGAAQTAAPTGTPAVAPPPPGGPAPTQQSNGPAAAQPQAAATP